MDKDLFRNDEGDIIEPYRIILKNYRRLTNMHGNLEPEENIWNNDKPVNDLYQDMERLNALYEELMWPHDVELDFSADYENNRIIIQVRMKI